MMIYGHGQHYGQHFLEPSSVDVAFPRRHDLSYELEALHLDEMSLGPCRKSPGKSREVVSPSAENDESGVRDLVETVDQT
jgi:hypothetical protein